MLHQPVEETDEMIEEMASPDGFYPELQTVEDLAKSYAKLLEENGRLRAALSEAILDTRRASIQLVEHAKFNSRYDATWLCKVREWANLCGLRLDDHDPANYVYRLTNS